MHIALGMHNAADGMWEYMNEHARHYAACAQHHWNYSVNQQNTRRILWLITKTSLFKYTENFPTKKWKFLDKNSVFFFIFLLKT